MLYTCDVPLLLNALLITQPLRVENCKYLQVEKE